MPTLKHLGFIETRFDPRVAETFRQLSQAVDNLANQAGLAGKATQAPPNVRSITVAAANGIFDIVITDPVGQAQPSLGIHYFVEYDTSAAFTNPFTLPLVAGRNYRVYLGSATLFFRAFSQFRFSPRSAYIYFGGSTPTGVVGGGSVGPAFSTSQGSGGKGGKGGFGG